MYEVKPKKVVKAKRLTKVDPLIKPRKKKIATKEDNIVYMLVKELPEVSTSKVPAGYYTTPTLSIRVSEYVKDDNGSNFDYISVRVYTSPTGCGLFHVSGITWINTKARAEAFKQMLKKAILPHVANRTLLITLGDAYKESQKWVLECGFIEVAKFVNPGHSTVEGTYYQHLYILPTTLEN